MSDAAALRGSVSELEWEASELGRKRQSLSKMVAAVEARDRDREQLVAKLETSRDFEAGFGMPLGPIGLAPPSQPVEASSPFDDDALVQDLLARDPRGGRALLFEMDPERYWRRFPLAPPPDALGIALRFPLADLPSRR